MILKHHVALVPSSISIERQVIAIKCCFMEGKKNSFFRIQVKRILYSLGNVRVGEEKNRTQNVEEYFFSEFLLRAFNLALFFA